MKLSRLTLLLFILSSLSLRAQVYISPENPGNSDEITLTYHADEGNAELANFGGEIYAHTGLILAESEHAGDWKNVAADWGQNKPTLQLKKLGDNRYQLKFRMDELYGIGPMQTVMGIAYVFRNSDGSKVGRSKEGGDIYHWFREPSFREPPKVAEVAMAPHPKWAESATIYEVNVRQYTPEGTFDAFAEHLPRLRQMGIDILWFMPIFPIGEKERKGSLGSYYSISDYTAINPEFGTMEDFKRLVDRCHGMGFHVVLDWVANHTSRDHAWIESHPKWYIMGDDGTPNAPHGWSDVAELEFDQYYLRDAMTEAMKFWVEECDVDGFRCDVAGEVPVDFWEDTREELDEIKPVWMLAEDASQLHLLNRAFNANYAWPVHHMMNEIAKGNEPARRFHDFFKELPEYYPTGSYPMQFITNHDENSWNGTVFERLGDGHKAFATLTFTMPGMPLIYSGQEAGNTKRLEFFDRDPIEWGDFSLVDFYAKLDELKSVNPALWNGTAGGDAVVIKNNQEDKVLSFVREKDGNKVVSVFNLSGDKKEVEIQYGKEAGIYREYFSGEETILEKRRKMTLAPWEYKVYIFEKELKEKPRKFQSAEPTGTGMKIKLNDGTINLTLYSENTMEVEFLPIGEDNPPSYSIDPEAKIDLKGKPVFKESEKEIKLSTSGLEIVVKKAPFQVFYFYKNQPLISEEKGFFDDGSQRGFRFNLSPDEKLTGGGERVLGVNRRGKKLQLYNKPSYGYETEADLMYYSLPIIISSKKYMLIFDNGASGNLDLGATEKNILQFDAVGGRMSYLITASDEWKSLAENFTAVTGRQPMPPRWTLGNIASRMGYHSQNEVENLIEKYEEDDIPLDCVVLDIFWFGPEIQGYLGNLDWYLDSFPQPQKMLDEMEEKGIKTVLITEPFIIKNTATYEEAMEKELVGKTASGEPYHYDFYFGNTLLIDVFKPEAQQWFWDIYKKHTLTGVDGWWGDLGEPEVHPDDIVHVNGTGAEIHNLYGHEWAKLVYDGFEKDFPDERPVILMRSGFVGSQRYGMVPWSGDVNRSWGGLKPQVEIALTMGLQGLAYMHSDLGGFAGDYEDSELYIRWLQYGVFQPIYRTHAQESVPPEPVFWDEKTKEIVKRYIELRYKLMPYNYTLVHENAVTGIPMMRPLFYEEDNIELFENTNAYMWGDAFLVSPVIEKGAANQEVYLPKNNVWFDFWNGRKYDGGQTVSVKLNLNEIPVFVKAGSFIPMTPVFDNMEEYTSEKLELHYFHDPSVLTSKEYMYEDDGKTKNSALAGGKNERLWMSSISVPAGLNIDFRREVKNEYEGMPLSREIELIVHNIETSPSFVSGGSENIKDFSWDEKEKVLRIKFEMEGNKKKIVIKY